MKRTLTLLYLLLFTGSFTQAQQIIYSENFEGICCNYINTWTHSYNTGAIPWQADYANVVGGNVFYPPNNANTSKVAAIIDNSHEDNVFMASHFINMQAVSGAYLSYDAYFLGKVQNNKTETTTIEISADSGATWSVLGNVPPYAYGFQKHFLNLAAYSNIPAIKLGLRYTDHGEIMAGCMIDNIRIFIPAHRDLAMVKITPEDSLLRFGRIGDPFPVSGQIFNNGIDTVTGFLLQYKVTGGATYTDTVSGVHILPFTSYNFVHAIPLNIPLAGNNDLQVWVALAGDTLHSNDTARTNILGTFFRPDKTLVIEEGTGTWNKYCPRGAVYMHALLNDYPATLISVHDQNDPMRVTDYQQYLFYLHYNYVPYFLFDRRENVSPDSFFTSFAKQKDYFGFANIKLQAQTAGNNLSVNTTVRPAIDLHGDYRLALVVTEDDVTGTTTDYDQKNYWAGGNNGVMGGYENKPDPVPAADMHYDFVARSISPAPDGDSNALPATMVHNNDYTATLTTTLNGAWNKQKLKAIVLLINMADSTVLNSAQVTVPLYITSISSPVSSIDLYPNPANDKTRLRFDLKETQDAAVYVTDITGKVLYEKRLGTTPAGTYELTIPTTALAQGFYFATIKTPSGKETVKLQVLH